MHLFHLFVRVSRTQKVPDSDLGWEDMYREGEGEPWFDWVRHLPSFILYNILSPQVPLDDFSFDHSNCRFSSQHILPLLPYQSVPPPSPT